MTDDNLNILVVDDEFVCRTKLHSILGQEGYDVILAEDGRQAMCVAQAYQPDLILLDIQMPDMDGFEVCSNLFLEPKTCQIPIIFLSTMEDEGSKVIAFDLGAVDYIQKPFYSAEVLARIRLHLKLSLSHKALVREQSVHLKELKDAQQSILVSPKDIPKANFGVSYSPIHEVGGDFYDVLTVNEHIFGYFVADISGHDIGSSFITPAIKALLRQNAGPVFNPKETLQNINSVLCGMMDDGNHVTACYIRLNRSKMTLEIANAGHPPLIYMPIEGEADTFIMEGDILGAFQNVQFGYHQIPVVKGDRIFMYSDGLIEGNATHRTQRTVGLERLIEVCSRNREESIQASVDRIYSDVLRGEILLEDDMVLLGFEV